METNHMIQKIALIAMILIITSSQTVVTPQTQMCTCSNLLSQQDCSAQQGCTWNITVTNNTNLTTTGLCLNSTSSIQNQSQLTVTYCSMITNQTMCAQSLGCAFFNNSCILFSGCSAYVFTSNSQCQAVSIQCTSDGTRCQDPQPCVQYTSQQLCQDNISTSGAKSCKWVQQSNHQASCSDKECSDAPSTYNTNDLCNNWIVGCLTTGQGCTNTLKTCDTYLQTQGCTGMVGSDGPCTSNTVKGSMFCRSLLCTDAPSTLSTNLDCQKFLNGCLTTGQGCVKTLQTCSSYQETQQCATLFGSEGPCAVDSTTTTCRALSCSDAPNSLTTNDQCNKFMTNCVTTIYHLVHFIEIDYAWQNLVCCPQLNSIDKIREAQSINQNANDSPHWCFIWDERSLGINLPPLSF